jgi:hypothetical protein
MLWNSSTTTAPTPLEDGQINLFICVSSSGRSSKVSREDFEVSRLGYKWFIVFSDNYRGLAPSVINQASTTLFLAAMLKMD